jgi:hypothetical protein
MFLKHKCIPKRQIYATQKATPPFAATREQAIINVSDFLQEVWNLFTLWKICPTHHRGSIRFRISDRKLVNHTTEMILWSMILVDGCLIFEHTKGNAEKVLKVEAMVKSRRLCPNRGDVPKGTVSIPLSVNFCCHPTSRLRLSLYIVSSKGFSLGWPS